jgi:hypothetical protein
MGTCSVGALGLSQVTEDSRYTEYLKCVLFRQWDPLKTGCSLFIASSLLSRGPLEGQSLRWKCFFFSASLTEIRVHYAFFYFCQKISIKATNHPSFYHPELINVDTGYILSNIFVYLPLQILAGMYIIKMKLKSRHAGERGLFIN